MFLGKLTSIVFRWKLSGMREDFFLLIYVIVIKGCQLCCKHNNYSIKWSIGSIFMNSLVHSKKLFKIHLEILLNKSIKKLKVHPVLIWTQNYCRNWNPWHLKERTWEKLSIESFCNNIVLRHTVWQIILYEMLLIYCITDKFVTLF